MDSATDRDCSAWAAHRATPWGQLQSRLLTQRLVTWLGPDPISSALDVGCGFGDLTAALAPQLDRIACVDRSPAMLAEAEKRLSHAVSAAFVERDLDAGLSDLGTHDLVIGHNVIDYTEDPRQAIRELCNCVGPSGRLSLSFGNGASLAIRYAVVTHDLQEALRLAQLPPTERQPGPCGPSIRLHRGVVEEWLRDYGIVVEHRAGVRVVTDLLPNDLKTDDRNLATIEALELELGERPELIDLAAIAHLMGRRI